MPTRYDAGYRTMTPVQQQRLKDAVDKAANAYTAWLTAEVRGENSITVSALFDASEKERQRLFLFQVQRAFVVGDRIRIVAAGPYTHDEGVITEVHSSGFGVDWDEDTKVRKSGFSVTPLPQQIALITPAPDESEFDVELVYHILEDGQPRPSKTRAVRVKGKDEDAAVAEAKKITAMKLTEIGYADTTWDVVFTGATTNPVDPATG